jgi:uridine kinase
MMPQPAPVPPGGAGVTPVPYNPSAMANAPVLLGVAGGTGSGKTTVARRILEAVGESRIALLEMDSYYKDIDWQTEGDLLHHNFDHPSALDLQLIAEHLRELKAGRAVEVPVYDFVTHRRTAQTETVHPEPVVMLEGILVLAVRELRDLLDFKIYVDTDADIRFIRRLQRDLDERGRDVADVMRQYLGSVRPMHLEFVEPSKRWADVIIPEGGENVVALEMVVARVEKILDRG